MVSRHPEVPVIVDEETDGYIFRKAITGSQGPDLSVSRPVFQLPPVGPHPDPPVRVLDHATDGEGSIHIFRREVDQIRGASVEEVPSHGSQEEARISHVQERGYLRSLHGRKGPDPPPLPLGPVKGPVLIPYPEAAPPSREVLSPRRSWRGTHDLHSLLPGSAHPVLGSPKPHPLRRPNADASETAEARSFVLNGADHQAGRDKGNLRPASSRPHVSCGIFGEGLGIIDPGLRMKEGTRETQKAPSVRSQPDPALPVHQPRPDCRRQRLEKGEGETGGGERAFLPPGALQPARQCPPPGVVGIPPWPCFPRNGYPLNPRRRPLHQPQARAQKNGPVRTRVRASQRPQTPLQPQAGQRFSGEGQSSQFPRLLPQHPHGIPGNQESIGAATLLPPIHPADIPTLLQDSHTIAGRHPDLALTVPLQVPDHPGTSRWKDSLEGPVPPNGHAPLLETDPQLTLGTLEQGEDPKPGEGGGIALIKVHEPDTVEPGQPPEGTQPEIAVPGDEEVVDGVLGEAFLGGETLYRPRFCFRSQPPRHLLTLQGEGQKGVGQEAHESCETQGSVEHADILFGKVESPGFRP